MGCQYVSGVFRGLIFWEITMGLLDVLNGMQNGPRGPSHPSTQSNGGMSPITMAILGLLAWKAVKHFSGSQPGTQAAPAPAPAPASPGGGLGNILAGGLGGLLGGGAAGGALSGGLGDLMKQLQQGGLGDAANSWVGSGENKQVSPGDLAKALGADQLEQLSSQSGMSRDELLKDLSQYLPRVVDHLTPDGRVPTDNEVSGRL
jgi:uncharacterized protein YidB (DUF937 family)